MTQDVLHMMVPAPTQLQLADGEYAPCVVMQTEYTAYNNKILAMGCLYKPAFVTKIYQIDTTTTADLNLLNPLLEKVSLLLTKIQQIEKTELQTIFTTLTNKSINPINAHDFPINQILNSTKYCFQIDSS